MTDKLISQDYIEDPSIKEEEYAEEEELGADAISDIYYNNEPELPSQKSVAKVMEAVNLDGTLKKIIRARRSDFVHNIIHLDGKKFSFDGRDYLRPIYDRDDRQVLLKTSRQVEKCGISTSYVVLANGSEKMLCTIKSGDHIIGSSPDGTMTVDTVIRSESNGQRVCKTIKTRLGSELTVTLNHPLRKLMGWVEADKLAVGDKIASLRTQGFFGKIDRVWAGLLGIQVSDGHYNGRDGKYNLGITKKDPTVKKWLEEMLDKCGFEYNNSYIDNRSGTTRYRFSVCGKWSTILDNLDLRGKNAHQKFLPDEVFMWNERSTIELLRGLWCTDGHCKNVTESKVDLVYSTTSAVLIRQVRLLLRKFGIVTTQREYQPKGEKHSKHYLLRVVTRRSIQAFYNALAPIPSKPFSVPEVESNSNLDTLPKDIHDLIVDIRKSQGNYWKRNSFLSEGLIVNRAYCPTYEKIAKMNTYLNDSTLQKILASDIIWDEIVSIEDAGECDTWAIETGTETYVSDFVVNHNTTYVGNNLTITSVVMPYNKALYVSPSHTQTRQFSNEKLRPAIEKSPLIKKYFQDSSVSTQVFEKGFTNGSYVFLRSAFRSADRCVAKGTRITLPDGSIELVENLVGKTPELLTTDLKHIDTKQARRVWSNGEKQVYSIELQSGHKVLATDNHRWVTPNEIKYTVDLVGSWVPIPLNFFSQDHGEEPSYAFLGYFLGDGCSAKNKHCSTHRLSFNNNNKEIIDDFCKIASSLKIECTIGERYNPTNLNYYVEIRGKENRENAESILKNFGALGKLWHERFIPKCVFGSRSRTRSVLRGMFESDGWVCYSEKNRQCEVGWVSGSMPLANDVLYCLQGMGIYAELSPKKPGTNSKSTSYNIKIRHSQYIKKFASEIGFISSTKSHKLKETLNFIEQLDCCSIGMDSPARDDVNVALTACGITDHALWEKHKISWRKNSTANKNRVSAHKIRKIYEITKDDRLLKYLNEKIVWVPIKGVTPEGISETFDISVDDFEVFTANGIFTHNTRGISARILCVDELQDFLGSELPVIMECTSHFLDARILMAGTPKSFDNPIEEYWASTTQNEWIVRCTHCDHQNFLDETNIGPTEFYMKGKLPPGPICKKCLKPIYPSKYGRWVSFNKDAPIKGYRIPQLMVPWICGLYDQWLKLLWKRDNYPFGQFYNEVLGLSYDSASKPVTQEELIECCGDYSLWNPADLASCAREAKKFQLTAGVDWGEGVDGSEKTPTGKPRTASYTVLTIGGYMNQKVWKNLLIKRYMGREIDPDYIVKDIARICNTLGVNLVGVDWGHGWGVNNHLIRILGPKRVVQYQHLPKLKQKMKWDTIGSRYHLHRNFMMSELFFDIKQKFVMFPKWSEFQPYAKDILGIFSEYVEYRREIKFDHKQSDPDDYFHSLLYAKLTSDVYLGKSRRYTFDIPDGLGQAGYLNSLAQG